MYYMDGLNYKQISRKLDISIAYISRLLKAGRESGIIEIRINDGGIASGTADLASRLQERFSLRDAVVQESIDTSDVNMIKRNVGSRAAHYLFENLEDGTKLGITWGKTIRSVIDELVGSGSRSLDLTSYQLCGNLSFVPMEINGMNLAARVGELFAGSSRLLSVPAFVDNEYIRDAILTDSSVRSVFDEYKEIQCSLTSVGSVSDLTYSTLYEAGQLDEERVAALVEKGVVGDILFHFYTLDGEIVDHEFSQQYIRMELDDYLRVPRKIVVAAGDYKLKAIYGAIAAGMVDILITDSDTATALLEMNT